MDVLPVADRIITAVVPVKTAVKTKVVKVPRDKIVVDVNIPNIPKEAKKESKKLKKKLQEISEKNENLSKAITDKNSEISDLKRSVKSLNEVLNSVPIDEMRCNSSIASTKILDLSKKNRQLRAELETTKNRVQSKDVQIQKLERELQVLKSKNGEGSESAKKNNLTLNELQTKVSALQQKLFETRNKNTELQTQLKLAQKCIQQEVGEHFNLNILAAQGQTANWRGRAQQIIHLQQKIQELRDRLEVLETNSENGVMGVISERRSSFPVIPGYEMPLEPPGSSRIKMENADLSQMFRTPAASKASSVVSGFSTTIPTTYDRFTPSVRKSEILHRNKVESLQKEIECLKNQVEEQRGKVLALKVRNKTLNEELVKSKMKASCLEDRTDVNDLSLSSISEKLNAQKIQYERTIKDLERKVNTMMREREEAEFREDELRNKLEETKDMVAEKHRLLEKQETYIEKLEKDMKSICGGFLFQCRELRKEDYLALLDSLETEKDHLLKHNNNLDERLKHERSQNEHLCDQLSKKKTTISRLESKIRELEREIEILTERKKRTQRITEYANSVTSMNSNVGSFVFENISLNSAHSRLLDNSEEITPVKWEDMKNQLEYANEKMILLEDKLARLIQEKNQDLRLFENAMTESKYRIVEAIRSREFEPFEKGSDSLLE